MPANSDIASIFSEIADILDIQGENAFRVRAYRNAARTVDGLAQSLSDMYASKPELLDELPGIGTALRDKIIEFCKTGKVKEHDDLRASLPPGLLEMLKIPSFGPKRVKLVHDKLKIDSVEKLEKAAQEGKIRELPGMGEKSEEKILRNIRDFRTLQTDRKSWPEAHRILKAYLAYLHTVQDIDQLEPAGSYRRRKETVGDLDILVTTSGSSAPIINTFTAYPEVVEVLAKGDTKASVILRDKIQVDLRVVEPGSFGAALQYFTGSKEHNVAVRKIAKDKGLKLSEYGVFKGEEMVAGKTEEKVYNAVGMSLIPPELRENRGEIEAAMDGTLPKLVCVEDIKGDLHLHSTYSDGVVSIPEMAQAAKERGYKYIAITDHSKAVTIASGLSEDRLLQQIEDINTFRETHPGIHVFSGIEVDIMSDGTLDYNDDILSQLDFVIAAVHSKFEMEESQMTERITQALCNPHVNCLAHPTGRKIGERMPYKVDMEAVIQAAREHNVALEINAAPERLDLDEILVDLARSSGVLIAIGTDAHRPESLASMSYGINVARRAWCSTENVINTWPLARLQKWLSK
jgi:DNA polymerase (family 10)